MPAAGRGQRLPGEVPKQYRRIAGRSLLDHSLAALLACPAIDRVLVGLAADDAHWADSEFNADPRLQTFRGGEERADTVLAGLEALAADWPDMGAVLVHDAARALLPAESLARLVAEVPGEDGALLAIPVADTVKRSLDGRRVETTVNRDELWLAQTPQYFRCDTLRASLGQAVAEHRQVTDEASAMEACGYSPRLVPGDPVNFKITTAADLALATLILEARCA